LGMVRAPSFRRSSPTKSSNASANSPQRNGVVGIQSRSEDSLEFRPEERMQVNLALVDHIMSKQSPTMANHKSSKNVNESSQSKKNRLKLPRKQNKATDSSKKESNEKGNETLALLQKINLSLTQEVTLLRGQRDQAVLAATVASEKLADVEKSKGRGVLSSSVESSQSISVEYNSPSTPSPKKVSICLDDGGIVEPVKAGVAPSPLSESSSPIGAHSQSSLLELEIRELRNKLVSKEKSMAFYRMELLKIKDSSKDEKEAMENEINGLKKQNVVNANRVVVLEDELRNIQEGRDDANTAEIIEQLQLENEDLKAQMERSLENMHKMSNSLKRKEESEAQLKKEVDEITLRELEVREELDSCRQAQELAVSDCGKLRDQVESLTTNNRNLQAKIKKQEKVHQLVKVSNPAQDQDSRRSNERHENASVVSEAKSIPSSQAKNPGKWDVPLSADRSDLVSDPTPVAVNTVASRMHPPNPSSQAAFLSALESINNIIDMGPSSNIKTSKSDSQSFVSQQNSPGVVSGRPPKADKSIFIPPSQDISVSEMQPYHPAPLLASTPQVTFEKAIPSNASPNPARRFSQISTNTAHRFSKVGTRENALAPPDHKEDDASSEGTAATFKNEIDEISLAYESISQRPSHNIKNKRALLSNKAKSSNKLTPFRLPEIPKFGNQGRYDNDDEDVLSTEISLKEDNIMETMPKRYVAVHSDPKKQQQDLNDTLFGMLSFLDSAEEKYSSNNNPSKEEPSKPVETDLLKGEPSKPVEANPSVEEPSKPVESDPSNEEPRKPAEANVVGKSDELLVSVGVAAKVAMIDEKEKQIVEANEEERSRLANRIVVSKDISRSKDMGGLPLTVDDIARSAEEKEAAKSLVEKLQADLEKSQSDLSHLEKQNLFIKQNYNDTVDILQKEAETNLRLKEEVQAKYEKDISALREEKLRQERALKRKLHEYESTLEIFEHAVASQNEVMTALVTKLELLQENEECYDEVPRPLTPVNDMDTGASTKTCHTDFKKSGREDTSQTVAQNSAPCAEDGLDFGADEEVHADFEVKDILLAEDGTPIVVKEIIATNDNKPEQSSNLDINPSSGVGMMRAWKELDGTTSQLITSSNPSLDLVSSVLIGMSKHHNKKEHRAMRKELEAQLEAQNITVEALGEAATQANESIRDIVTQLHTKTKQLDEEKVRTSKLENLLSEREMVIVAVAKAISEQETIMNNLDEELDQIAVIDVGDLDIDDISDTDTPTGATIVKQSPQSRDRRLCGECVICDEMRGRVRELEVSLEDSKATEFSMAEEITRLRENSVECDDKYCERVRAVEEKLKHKTTKYEKMELRLKLAENNSNQVIDDLKKCVNKSGEEQFDLFVKVAKELDLMRKKEELLADELEDRLRDKGNTAIALERVDQMRSQIESSLRKCETASRSTSITEETSADIESLVSGNENDPYVTVVDTQLIVEIQEQLNSLRVLEEELKNRLQMFETDNDVLAEGFGMNRGDRRALAKLREELAVFLGQSRAALHQLEDKVTDYMGSMGEERYRRIKELESQLEDKEKMVKLMEKQSAYQEQTLSSMRAEFDKLRNKRKIFGR